MTKVGLLGLGMMGNTHLDVYAKLEGVTVAAVADRDPDRLSGKAKAGGNIEGQAQGGASLADAEKFTEAEELIEQADVDVIDICLPTPAHRALAEKAMAAGKHVMVEKPLARTARDAAAIADAADRAGVIAMPGMCMRFWPGWTWLKQAVEEQTYGPVRSACFRRLAQHPGGRFYNSGEASGGAILDLHVHDTDFVQHLLGTPAAVTSQGYAKITDQPDHVLTQYRYDAQGPALVVAEGGWAMADGFGFQMSYTVNFDQATASFVFDGKNNLTLARDDKAEQIPLDATLGYEHEIRYFIDCVTRGHKPTTVTLAQAAESVRIVEAERQSITSGQSVSL